MIVYKVCRINNDKYYSQYHDCLGKYALSYDIDKTTFATHGKIWIYTHVGPWLRFISKYEAVLACHVYSYTNNVDDPYLHRNLLIPKSIESYWEKVSFEKRQSFIGLCDSLTPFKRLSNYEIGQLIRIFNP